MNGTQIMNTVIAYSTPEIDTIKEQMSSVLDMIIEKIAPAKAQGMSELDIKVGADMMIRSRMRKILGGKEDYMVERNGRPALLHVGSASVVNAIVEMVESQI